MQCNHFVTMFNVQLTSGASLASSLQVIARHYNFKDNHITDSNSFPHFRPHSITIRLVWQQLFTYGPLTVIVLILEQQALGRAYFRHRYFLKTAATQPLQRASPYRDTAAQAAVLPGAEPAARMLYRQHQLLIRLQLQTTTFTDCGNNSNLLMTLQSLRSDRYLQVLHQMDEWSAILLAALAAFSSSDQHQLLPLSLSKQLIH